MIFSIRGTVHDYAPKVHLKPENYKYVPENMDGLRHNHSVDRRERRVSHAAPQAGVGCSPFQVISQNMISASNFDLRIGIQSRIGLKSINFLTQKWSMWIGTWREKVAFLAIGKKNLRPKYDTTQGIEFT